MLPRRELVNDFTDLIRSVSVANANAPGIAPLSTTDALTASATTNVIVTSEFLYAALVRQSSVHESLHQATRLQWRRQQQRQQQHQQQ
jgi:hypothetical protein